MTLHIQLKRHDNRRIAVAPDGRDLFLTYTPEGKAISQPHLVRALGQAFYWRQQILKSGATIATIAKHDQLTLELDAAQMEACKADEEFRRPSDRAMDGAIPTCLYQPRVEQRGKLVVLMLIIQIKRLDGRRLLLSPDGHDLFMLSPPDVETPFIVV